MAQIIIAKHRKGATKDVLVSFRGEFTRFANKNERYAPIDNVGPMDGEIISSALGGGENDPLSGDVPPSTAGLEELSDYPYQ